MVSKEITLIGIDGGATKVSGWIINVLSEANTYELSTIGATISYTSAKGFSSEFSPVSVADQIEQRDRGSIKISDEEKRQGDAYIESAVQVIKRLFTSKGRFPLVIGIGMPGLKTADLRGINVIANGPRILSYCERVEALLAESEIPLATPVARLGSDADYCGIGELYAADGGFRSVQNAYYLGGGTGTADALLLRGELMPFDRIRSWMAKAWEMKNDKNVALERYASAAGLQYIFAQNSGIPTEQLNHEKIFPAEIAAMAVKGHQPAVKSFQEITDYLALLLFERITTLYCGTRDLFTFVNPGRAALTPQHDYRTEVFDRIVIGQRLGELMGSKEGNQVLTSPVLKRLASLIREADYLPADIKEHYINGTRFREKILRLSRLREAPVLGAGIDAHLCYSASSMVKP